MFAAAVMTGCAGRVEDFPRSTFEVVEGAFRTFTVAHGPAYAPTTCADFLAEHPLRGILRGDVTDPERIWMETEGGRRVSVVWPHGFRAVPAEPDSSSSTIEGRSWRRSVSQSSSNRFDPKEIQVVMKTRTWRAAKRSDTVIHTSQWQTSSGF
jgi:hypothetical protein